MNRTGCSLLLVGKINSGQHCKKPSVASRRNSAWRHIGFKIIFHDFETECLIRLKGRWLTDKEVNYA